eukprot:3397364-Lingulodinium_polyedra.AAC.1
MCVAAATECISERVSEQFACASCSDMFSEIHCIAAAPRVSQRTRSMRRPPHGVRRVECATRDVRGDARTEC